MGFLIFLAGFILGCLAMFWLIVEFIKDQASNGKMFFKDTKGKWIPTNPFKM